MTDTPQAAALLDLAVAGWRATRVFGSAIEKLDAVDRQRYLGQLQYFADRVVACAAQGGFRLINLEGQSYDSGMAITPLNLGDFSAEQRLLVVTMLEPVVMGPSGVVRLGTAILGARGA